MEAEEGEKEGERACLRRERWRTHGTARTEEEEMKHDYVEEERAWVVRGGEGGLQSGTAKKQQQGYA